MFKKNKYDESHGYNPNQNSATNSSTHVTNNNAPHVTYTQAPQQQQVYVDPAHNQQVVHYHYDNNGNNIDPNTGKKKKKKRPVEKLIFTPIIWVYRLLVYLLIKIPLKILKWFLKLPFKMLKLVIATIFGLIIIGGILWLCAWMFGWFGYSGLW